MDYESLNNSELRLECGKLLEVNPAHSGHYVPLWLDREQLIAILRDGAPIPPDPMRDIRVHQILAMVERADVIVPQLPQKLPDGGACTGCCFSHGDMRVIECQLHNREFRHPKFPKQK